MGLHEAFRYGEKNQCKMLQVPCQNEVSGFMGAQSRYRSWRGESRKASHHLDCFEDETYNVELFHRLSDLFARLRS